MNFNKLFISYARADDKPFVERLYNDLIVQKITAWWDFVDMPSRALPFPQEIQQAIDSCERLLLIWGPKASESDWVRKEWEYALSICKPVNVILRLEDGSQLPEVLRGPDYRDFRQGADYDAQFKRLVEQLQDTPAPLGFLSNVPGEPPHYLLRTDDLVVLKQHLLADKKSHVVVTGTARKIGVQGMGGIGKSVLAAAAARDCEVRRAFPDGVIWLTLGKDGVNPITRQMQLADALNDHPQPFADVQAGKAHLSQLLENKSCLLILDDVWHVDHAQAFDVLGPGCRLLVTTREQNIVTVLGAHEVPVDMLSNDAALSLLASWVEQSATNLPNQARQVVEECGRLPLALAMVGAMLRDIPDRWDNVLHKLQNADLDRIQQEFPHYPYPSLMRAIQVSVDALDDIEHLKSLNPKARYLEMSVFPADTLLSEATLVTYWETVGLDKFDIQDLLDTFVKRSLARRYTDNRLTLHDLQFDYVGKYSEDKNALHERLVTAYQRKCPKGWASGPNDGYFFEHLAYHLRIVGRHAELYDLLTASPAWMEAKFAACMGDTSYAADLDQAIADLADPLDADQTLILARLHTARQVVHARVSAYTDDDLKILVWLGHEKEALSHARLRSEPLARFDGLMAIYEVQWKQTRADVIPLNECYRLACGVKDKESQAEALSALGIALAQAGEYEQAHEIANTIQDESSRVEVLSSLATALTRANKHEQAQATLNTAREVVSAIQNDEKRVFALRALAAALTQAREYEEARAITENLENDKFMSRTLALRDLATALAQAREYEQAQAVAESIWHVRERADALSALAAILAQGGEAKRATYVFDQAQAVVESIQYGDERAAALCELAAALVQAGETEHATHVFDQAQVAVENVRLDDSFRTWVFALCDLATALIQASKYEQAREVFQTAQRVIESIEHDMFGMRTDALRDLVASLAQTGEYKQAQVIAENIQEKGMRAATLRDLAIALAQAGETEQARHVFTEARELVDSIQDEKSRAAALTALATALVQAGETERATRVFAKGQVVVESIRYDGERAAALRALAAALFQAGETQHATYVFAQLPVVAESIQDKKIRADVLRDLAVALVQAGETEGAARVFAQVQTAAESIQDEKSRAATLRDLAVSLTEAGETEHAIRVFAQVQTVAESIQDEEHRVTTLCDLAVSLAQGGKYEQAKEVFQTAQKVIECIEDHMFFETRRPNALRALAAALAQAREYEQAQAVAESIQDEWGRAAALNVLAISLAQAREYEQAQAVAESIQDERSRADALSALAVALAQVGETEHATRVFTHIQTVTESIQDEWGRAAALNVLAISLAQAREYEQAQAVAESIQDERSRADALSALAAALVQAGELERAQTVIESFEDNWIGSRADTLRDLGVALARAGVYTQAGVVINSIQDFRWLKWQAGARCDLAAVLTQTGHIADAFDTLGTRTADEFVQVVAEWSPSLEIVQQGTSLTVLREVTRILGWVHPDWHEIHQLLTAENPS